MSICDKWQVINLVLPTSSLKLHQKSHHFSPHLAFRPSVDAFHYNTLRHPDFFEDFTFLPLSQIPIPSSLPLTPFVNPNFSLSLSSTSTTPTGPSRPIPKNTNSAHFQRNGLMATQNTNHHTSSRYVKKSNAPVGLKCFSSLVMSIQHFVHHGRGRVIGSRRNINRMRV